MKAILLPLALFASAAVAQTSSVCGADYIVEACLGSENAKLAGCGDSDWGCKCQAYTDILTCYNNCPNDPRKDNAAGQKQIFCGYASQYPSSTKAAAKASGGNSSPSASATPTHDGTSAAGSSSTATGSGAPATKSNSAADLALNAGGVLAAVAGVVAAVL